jgi:hypothetical protein
MGDDNAWRNLVESWLPFAFDRLTRRGTPPAQAADALTAAFTEIREHLDEDAARGFATRVVRAITAAAGGETASISAPPPSDPKRAASRITRGTDAAAVAADDDVAALLFEAAVVLGAPTADVLDLHWRAGLDASEIAAGTGMEPGMVDDRIAKLPSGYAAALRTRLLWLDGTPAHDELAGELRDAGVTSFDATASRLIHRHIRACSTCRGRSLVALPAVELFGAIPFAPLPAEVREQVLAVVAAPTAGEATEEPEAAAEEPDGEAAEAPTEADSTAELEATAEAAAEEPTEAGSTTEPVITEPAKPETTDATGGPEPIAASDASEPTAESPVADSTAQESDASERSARTLAPVGAAVASAAAGAPGSDPTPGPAHQPVASRRAKAEEKNRNRRLVAIGLAAAIVLAAIVAFAATRGGDDGRTELDVASATDDSTTTTRRSTTTLARTSTSTSTTTSTTTPETSTTNTVASTTTTGGGFPPPPVPETTTTTMVRLTHAVLDLSPKKVTSGNCATLTWQVSATGPVEVSVTGPGVSSNLLGGSAQACAAGTYSMTVTSSGVVLASRSQQLEVKP